VKIARTDPLGQVFALLDDLAAKITKEGEKEATAYKAFVEWCDDASSNKGFEIKTLTANKEKLEALITKTSDSAAAAADKIEELAASIAGDEADLKSATTIREKEVSEFSTNEAELGDVVDTLGRAIAIVEREMAKNPAAFAQVDTSKIDKLLGSLGAVVEAAGFSAVDRKKLLAMVQSQQGDDADSDELGAPAAAVYKSHSANIVDVLEDLKEKAEEQLAGLRKAETSAKHNYEMLKQSLEDQISADSKDLQEQKDGKAASEQAKAVAEGDLAMTAKGLVDAKGALELCHSNCLTTAADHEATVAARTAELKVLAEAKALLQSSTPGAAGHVYSFLEEEQQHTQAGTVQVGSSLRTRTDLVNAEVVHMVKELAKKHHSQALNQLASRIAAVVRFGTSAGEDPFTKVKALVEELISKLESEASSEAGEKDYCDEQMSKTEAKKGELEHDISKLTAKIDQAVAQSSSLKGAVKDAQAELATLAKEQAEMDKMRSEGHAAYVEAKAVLEDGLEGVRKALGVLRDYYGGDAAAAALQESSSAAGGSFLQQPVVPEIHEKAQGAGSSIMGILEVVESDIAKSLAAEEAQETDAEVEYEKVTQENAIAKTLKDQSVKYNTQEFKSLDKSVADLSGDRETTNTELSAVVEYYAKIKERCIAKPEAYEERKQRREAEIAGLKEALQVLEEETAFVQRRHRNRSPFLRGFDGRL
jgi:peptidoglycan hydrolase CwlO-like protein